MTAAMMIPMRIPVPMVAAMAVVLEKKLEHT